MPFEQFDRSRLHLLPLKERIHDLSIDVMVDPSAPVEYSHPTVDLLADRVRAAREKGASVLMMLGGHVIRAGVAPCMIDLMEKAYITHFAMNGAAAIHDFEFALIGATTESVAKYISEGQFGLWEEDSLYTQAINEGAALGLGAGESLGKFIEEHDFPYKQYSLLAACYRRQVPATVHIGIGCDIVHEQPNADGAALGQASYTDFLIYAKTVENLENGVFLNFGSAVTVSYTHLRITGRKRGRSADAGRPLPVRMRLKEKGRP